MLKGIPKILSPELLKVLCEMGHSDRIVLADDGADTTCLFGLTEDRVIMVLYYGEAEPEQYLDKLYDLAANTP